MPVVLLALIAAAPAAAQDNAVAVPAAQQNVTAKQAIETAKQAYGPPTPQSQKACPTPKPGSPIVVCAQVEDQSQFRVKSSAELDPTGAGAKDDIPRAPDLAPHYPGPVVARGCFVPPCPPPMPKLIDLKAIPEAPPGSDADRVAHGLAPTGYEGPPVKPKPKSDSARKGEGPGGTEADTAKTGPDRAPAPAGQPATRQPG